MSETIAKPTLSSTKRELLSAWRKGKRAASEIPRVADANAIPLSPTQERFWFMDQLQPLTAAFNLAFAARIDGRLDRAALERTLREIARRHEPFRMRFSLVEARPRAHVEELELNAQAVETIEVPGATPEERRISALVLAQAKGREPFDLTRAPLARVALLKIDDDEQVLVVAAHHTVFDGWSMGVFAYELVALYDAYAAGRSSPLPELPIRYRDYAVWQRERLASDVLARELLYWQHTLSGSLPLLDLPADRPRPALATLRGKTLHFSLPSELCREIKALAKAHDATLFMLLLTALEVVLHRISGEVDLVIGTPVANRARAELEGLIGAFINVVPLRVQVAAAATFASLLRSTRMAALSAFAHAEIPFERVVQALQIERDMGRSPLFQVMFVLQNSPLTSIALDGVRFTPLALDLGSSQYDLTLFCQERDGEIDASIAYSSDLFDESTMAALASAYVAVLRGIVAKPESRVAELPLLDATQRQRQLVEWNATARDFSSDACVHALIAQISERHPERIAIELADTRITYRELEARAGALAGELVRRGAKPGVAIGVALERSAELPIALLACLKTGGFYVPLDPALPSQRFEALLADAGTALVITRRASTAPVPASACVYSDDEPTFAAVSERFVVPPPDASSPAYMIYTSGSTGMPKGCINAHRALVNRLEWMRDEYDVGPDDRILHKTPFTFDVSVWELFLPLITGACLVLAKPEGQRDSRYLSELIDGSRITLAHFVPAMLDAFLEEPALSGCPTLRHVICSGEALKPATVARFHARMHGALHNLYGPTECAIDVSAWPCRRDAACSSVPIGKPIQNTQLYVLDHNLQPVPAGMPGELYIGGIQVGIGYHARPQLNAERFIDNPLATGGPRLYRTGDLVKARPDGAYEFLGRLDHQVKLRGMRIELGEIEAHLEAHPGVRQAAVLVHVPEAGAGPQLVACVTGAGERAPSALELRRDLAERLPEYMIPTRVVPVPELPLSSNGKLDRRKLSQLIATSAAPEVERIAARSGTEHALFEIWSDVLGTSAFGIDDNFFALGGDSIRALRVRTRCEQAGLSLSLQTLFAAQTIRTLALAAEQQAEPEASPALAAFALIAAADRDKLPRSAVDAYPLTQLQTGMIFHTLFSERSSLYRVVTSLEVHARLELASLHAALEEVIRRHPVLRTTFALTGFSVPLQIVHERGVLACETHDLSGLESSVQRDAVATWIDTIKYAQFSFEALPLLRFQVHVLDDGRFQLSVVEHHAVLDGWSDASMLVEVLTLYRALLAHERMPVHEPDACSFADFVALELAAVAAVESKAFWEQQLAQVRSCRLPQRLSPAEPVHKLWRFSVPAESLARLRSAALTAGVPLKSLLLATHLRVMRLVNGKTEIVTGLVASGRPERRGGDRVLGVFLNTLPFKCEVAAGSWGELARAAFAHEMALMPHRRYPLVQIVKDHGSEPFDSYFNFVHFHIGGGRQGDALRVLDARGVAESNFALAANYLLDPQHDTLTVELDCDVGALNESFCERLLGYYQRALAAAADQAAVEPSLLGDLERERLLRSWNDTQRPYLQERIEDSFARTAAAAGQRSALVCDEHTLSYAALEQRAEQICAQLERQGVKPRDLVAVVLPRSCDLVAALLGVLKAGAAYVPVDPGYPRQRIEHMLQHARVAAVLTHAGLRERLLGTTSRVLTLDEPAALAPEACAAAGGTRHVGDAAYVIYTSGSSGRPKGVTISHRNVANFFAGMDERVGCSESDTLLAVTSVSFDIAVLELLWTLTRGAKVVLASDRAVGRIRSET